MTMPLRIPITAGTSTVLGHPGKQLWHHLLWGDGVWVDPGPDPFGGTGYQYLHVPARNPLDGPPAEDGLNVVYRVRPRWEPGQVVRHKGFPRVRVASVRVELVDDKWWWVIEREAKPC